MTQPCSVDDCDRPAAARGWCHRHWARWRRNGDPVRPAPRVGTPVDYEDGTRLCKDCGERKDLDDYPRDPNATKGHRALCKPCHSRVESARYSADADRYREKQKQYRQNNPETVRAQDRERYQRDKPKRLELVIESMHRRRALLHDLPADAGITIGRLRRIHGDRCCYCQTVMDFTPPVDRQYRPTRATLEHVVPLTRGGGHTWPNVALACWRCNVRKNNRTVDEWMPDHIEPDRHDEQLRLWA